MILPKLLARPSKRWPWRLAQFCQFRALCLPAWPLQVSRDILALESVEPEKGRSQSATARIERVDCSRKKAAAQTKTVNTNRTQHESGRRRRRLVLLVTTLSKDLEMDPRVRPSSWLVAALAKRSVCLLKSLLALASPPPSLLCPLVLQQQQQQQHQHHEQQKQQRQQLACTKHNLAAPICSSLLLLLLLCNIKPTIDSQMRGERWITEAGGCLMILIKVIIIIIII